MITEFKIDPDKQDEFFRRSQEQLAELANGTLAMIFNLHDVVNIEDYTQAFLNLSSCLGLLQYTEEVYDAYDAEARIYYENIAVVMYIAERILQQGLIDAFQALCPDDGICVNMGDYSMFVPQSALIARYNHIYVMLDRFRRSGSHSMNYIQLALESNDDNMTQLLTAMEKVGMKLVKVST